jgi:hypothetical protein
MMPTAAITAFISLLQTSEKSPAGVCISRQRIEEWVLLEGRALCRSRPPLSKPTLAHVGAAEGCDLLIFNAAEDVKIKKSQPSAAPTGGFDILGGA